MERGERERIPLTGRERARGFHDVLLSQWARHFATAGRPRLDPTTIFI